MPPRIPNTDCTKTWTLDQALVYKVCQVVQVADVITLKLESCAIIRTSAKDVFNVLVGVFENEVTTVFKVLALPLMLEFLESIEHGEKAKVHRTHVQRGKLRLERHRWLHAFLNCHVRAATRSQIYHCIGGSLDLSQKTGRNASGSCVGRPSFGSRACKCKIAAPARAASIADLAISSGVTGK